jgi:hypothetical protein
MSNNVTYAGRRSAAREVPTRPASVGSQHREAKYWLAPVAGGDGRTPKEVVSLLVGKRHVWAFGDKQSARRMVKTGDWICFYASAVGVVGHARVASDPEYKKDKRLWDPDTYCWPFEIAEPRLYLNNPVVIDVTLRRQLDAFKGKNLEAPWGWFVVTTSKLTVDDFRRLTQ